MSASDALLEKEWAIVQNRVWVRISSVCNNRCLFCLDSDAQDGTFVDDDRVRREIRESYRMGEDNRIIISGGEASINPRFPDYIGYAREIWYHRIQTVTNGNMFSDEDFCRRVFAAGLQEVTFSFHGHTARLHDYLVDTPGAFQKSLKGLLYIRKYFPEVVVNVDIVVNKVNVSYLPDIVRFFMRLGIYEFDILQIIPFWRWFQEHRERLFYDVISHISILQETWELSRVPWVHMWTNRFPTEAFEGHESLIQDPRKIKSEVLGEAAEMFTRFISSGGAIKPDCFGDACWHCFLHQYCHDFISQNETRHLMPWSEYIILNTALSRELTQDPRAYYILRWESSPKSVYQLFGTDIDNFRSIVGGMGARAINVPLCLGWSGIYETYADMGGKLEVSEYTRAYISNLYFQKSIRCKSCIHASHCRWLHVNFVRSYGFALFSPIVWA